MTNKNKWLYLAKVRLNQQLQSGAAKRSNAILGDEGASEDPTPTSVTCYCTQAVIRDRELLRLAERDSGSESDTGDSDSNPNIIDSSSLKSSDDLLDNEHSTGEGEAAYAENLYAANEPDEETPCGEITKGVTIDEILSALALDDSIADGTHFRVLSIEKTHVEGDADTGQSVNPDKDNATDDSLSDEYVEESTAELHLRQQLGLPVCLGPQPRAEEGDYINKGKRKQTKKKKKKNKSQCPGKVLPDTCVTDSSVVSDNTSTTQQPYSDLADCQVFDINTAFPRELTEEDMAQMNARFENFWAQTGEMLVWKLWVQKYPDHVQYEEVTTVPAVSEVEVPMQGTEAADQGVMMGGSTEENAADVGESGGSVQAEALTNICDSVTEIVGDDHHPALKMNISSRQLPESSAAAVATVTQHRMDASGDAQTRDRSVAGDADNQAFQNGPVLNQSSLKTPSFDGDCPAFHPENLAEHGKTSVLNNAGISMEERIPESSCPAGAARVIAQSNEAQQEKLPTTHLIGLNQVIQNTFNKLRENDSVGEASDTADKVASRAGCEGANIGCRTGEANSGEVIAMMHSYAGSGARAGSEPNQGGGAEGMDDVNPDSSEDYNPQQSKALWQDLWDDHYTETYWHYYNVYTEWLASTKGQADDIQFHKTLPDTDAHFNTTFILTPANHDSLEQTDKRQNDQLDIADECDRLEAEATTTRELSVTETLRYIGLMLPASGLDSQEEGVDTSSIIGGHVAWLNRRVAHQSTSTIQAMKDMEMCPDSDLNQKLNRKRKKSKKKCKPFSKKPTHLKFDVDITPNTTLPKKSNVVEKVKRFLKHIKDEKNAELPLLPDSDLSGLTQTAPVRLKRAVLPYGFDSSAAEFPECETTEEESDVSVTPSTSTDSAAATGQAGRKCKVKSKRSQVSHTNSVNLMNKLHAVNDKTENPDGERTKNCASKDNLSENSGPDAEETAVTCQNESGSEAYLKKAYPLGKRLANRIGKDEKLMPRLPMPAEVVENVDLHKYWHQRYRLFSRYDQGVQLDTESWYSVTPEKIACHTALRCQCDLIIDAFCGAGGNAIQFAFTCERVIAIDIDPEKLKMAKHNAKIYGVDDRIEFVLGNYLDLAPTLKADVVYLSPPWGGPQYLSQEVYDLNSVPGLEGSRLFEASRKITTDIAFYVPRNVNVEQLTALAGTGGRVEIEQNLLNKKVKTITAFYGDLVMDGEVSDNEVVPKCVKLDD